jgi:hypothetical protein
MRGPTLDKAQKHLKARVDSFEKDLRDFSQKKFVSNGGYHRPGSMNGRK